LIFSDGRQLEAHEFVDASLGCGLAAARVPTHP